jgi:hypothetical protein
MSIFNFELTPIHKLMPWGNPGEYSMHWFGLTDGHYWIEVDGVDLLKLTEEIRALWKHEGFPYIDYQVARLFEDLLEMLPHILEPLPPDISDLIATSAKEVQLQRHWRSLLQKGGENIDIQLSDAVQWWGMRRLDFGYLRYCPRINFWREGDMIFIRWDCRVKNDPEKIRVFVADSGTTSINAVEFIKQVRLFHDNLFQQMEQRVEDVSHSWPHDKVALDVNALKMEHVKRRQESQQSLNAPCMQTDWDAVRRSIIEMMRISAP